MLHSARISLMQMKYTKNCTQHQLTKSFNSYNGIHQTNEVVVDSIRIAYIKSSALIKCVGMCCIFVVVVVAIAIVLYLCSSNSTHATHSHPWLIQQTNQTGNIWMKQWTCNIFPLNQFVASGFSSGQQIETDCCYIGNNNNIILNIYEINGKQKNITWIWEKKIGKIFLLPLRYV